MVENGESNVFGPGVFGVLQLVDLARRVFLLQERLRSFNYCTSRSPFLTRYNPTCNPFILSLWFNYLGGQWQICSGTVPRCA